MFECLLLVFIAAGVGVMCLFELSLELFLIVVILLEEVLFIIGGNCCQEDVVDVLGKDDDIVGGEVGVGIYYLELEFRVIVCDSETVGSEEIKEFMEVGAEFRM